MTIGIPRTRGAFFALAAVAVVAACQEAAGPIWVDSLSLEPDSVFLVPGETAEFSSVPRDQRDNPLPERSSRTEWAVSNGGVATIAPNGSVATVTALSAGTATVQVSLGRGTGSGPVYVEPAELREIRIDPPESPIILDADRRGLRVRAVLIGLDGEEVAGTGYRISWRTTNWRVAGMVGTAEVVNGPSTTISSRGLGQVTFTLQVGDRKLSVPVTVR